MLANITVAAIHNTSKVVVQPSTESHDTVASIALLCARCAVKMLAGVENIPIEHFYYYVPYYFYLNIKYHHFCCIFIAFIHN